MHTTKSENQTSASPSAGSGWLTLAKLSGVTAVILLVYSLATMVSLIVIGGQPLSANEGFEMLAENRLVGALRLDLLTTLVMPIYYVLFFGLYVAHRKTHDLFAGLVCGIGFAGVTLFLATPSVFSWLALSDKYAAAASAEQQAFLLAAGEAILAADMWHGSGAIMGGALIQTSTLFFSIFMLRNPLFSRWTTWIGIITHGIDLLHVLVGMVVPSIGVSLMFVAGPLYLVWFPLLARDFFKMGKAIK